YVQLRPRGRDSSQRLVRPQRDPERSQFPTQRRTGSLGSYEHQSLVASPFRSPQTGEDCSRRCRTHDRAYSRSIEIERELGTSRDRTLSRVSSDEFQNPSEFVSSLASMSA